MHRAKGWWLSPFVSCRLHLLFYFKDPSTHYSQKLVGLQTGAPNQHAVHAMPAEERSGVIRYDAAAILNGQPVGFRLAIDLTELASQDRVGVLRLFRGRVVVCITDRPYRFVCNAQVGQGL